jgi:CheY-like chemotaxis protein
MSTARPRILVVDDVPLFREVESLYLARIGEVRSASSAAEARALFASEPAEVVVVDLHLPDAPGDALCREMLAAAQGDTRVVVVTRGEAKEHARAIAAGAAEVLAKPLARSELVSSVRRLVGELRGQPRACLREPAHFWVKGRISTGTLQNISRGGAFLAAGWIPREGTDLKVEFALPGNSTPLTVPARVMWRRYEGTSSGFGLRFSGLDGVAQDRLTRFVELNEAAGSASA